MISLFITDCVHRRKHRKHGAVFWTACYKLRCHYRKVLWYYDKNACP